MEILPYPSLDEIKSWSDSPDTLLSFWNIWATEKAWAQITAECQMFDYIEVQSKVVFEPPSNQCCCQWCFWILLFKKIVLIFCAPFDVTTYILCSNFFPNCGNPSRPHSRINPVVQLQHSLFMAQFNNASIHVSLYAPCVLATLLCAIVHWLAFRHIICLAMNL